MSSQRNRVVGAGTQVATEVSINFGSSVAGLLIPTARQEANLVAVWEEAEPASKPAI